jgi:23S rRNA (cytosine1962-C5)-methyltransferase
MTDRSTVRVSRRGGERWLHGHPWIYRSDVIGRGPPDADVVEVALRNGQPLGAALWSPHSEIRLRRLDDPGTPIDRDWWQARIAAAASRRTDLVGAPTAFRLVHSEADGLPSLIVDRYGDVLAVQLLSAGIETMRETILDTLEAQFSPAGIVLRHDASVRRHEGLSLDVVVARGRVPDEVEVSEAGIRYGVLPLTGQKTGAFLDQRDNRIAMRALARGSALDVFTYQGHFALHLAQHATGVIAIDQSTAALEQARRNEARNDGAPIEWREGNAFDELRALQKAGARFDTIVLDPPAFVKSRAALAGGLRGYKEVNLRALKLLRAGGRVLTCSCSFHVDSAAFMRMLGDAAADSGRRIAVERVVAQSADHPVVLSIPESGYLKGAILRAID